jgi:hypothetical protein
MGEARAAAPVKLVCGLIAVDDPSLIREAGDALTEAFGGIDLESEPTPFDFTPYYRAEMGEGLVRKFFSFARSIDPGELSSIKRATIAIEERFARRGGERPGRRVNLDPGYVTAAKLVLATTKDFAHRVYLRDGIYAEVTLAFHKSGIGAFAWTYPDFRSGRYDAFFLEVRRRCLETARPTK